MAAFVGKKNTHTHQAGSLTKSNIISKSLIVISTFVKVQWKHIGLNQAVCPVQALAGGHCIAFLGKTPY